MPRSSAVPYCVREYATDNTAPSPSSRQNMQCAFSTPASPSTRIALTNSSLKNTKSRRRRIDERFQFVTLGQPVVFAEAVMDFLRR